MGLYLLILDILSTANDISHFTCDTLLKCKIPINAFSHTLRIIYIIGYDFIN